MGEVRSMHGKIPLGRLGSTSKDNIKIYLRKTGRQGLDLIHPMRATCTIYLATLTTFGKNNKPAHYVIFPTILSLNPS